MPSGVQLQAFRNTLVIGAVCVSLVGPAPAPVEAAAKRKAPSASSTTSACAELNRSMDGLSKSLAVNFAEGIGDESTQRATLRETQYQGLLQRARMNMDLMRANRCRLPTSVPTGKEYVGDAIDCQALILRTGRYTSEGVCDQSSWKPKKASR